MLVLSRKWGEAIVINNNVTVTVVEIRGDKVRLGIEAPKDVSVHRYEVWATIQRESADASSYETNKRRPLDENPNKEEDGDDLRPY